MGQGYSLTTLPAGSAGIDVPEMSDLTYEKSLGNARFMKCIRARHKDGLVIAKVVMKPYSTLELDRYIKVLIAERKALTEIPNALGYHRIVETSTNGYLVRQYIHSSLYDRMSTRPFLEDIEKKWLAFQLLCAVRDCHARNIYHGDIKTENILVTSWNWLYLSDFSSSFKPTYLPEDNPADFSFFFDTSGRRTCYLAPERFLRPGEDAIGKAPINWAMDIFSVGCVIAELFLETPIFSLSQLFRYRLNKDYEPQHIHLGRIVDRDIRDMVTHMIQIDPQDRYSAEEYLNFWKHKAFPEYFYSFLHQYMYLITDPTSGRSPLTAGQENLGEADDRVERVYYDFDKVSYFLGYESSQLQGASSRQGIRAESELFPLQIDIPNNRHEASSAVTRPSDDGTLIFLTLVVASLRSTARATARVRACELLLAFAERITDEAKLDRILPFLSPLLNDKTDVVKMAAIRTITQLLALVSVVSPINSYIFPEYLLPKFQQFVSTPKSKASPWVRATYASCLGSLATTASRFLDMKQALHADGSLPTNDPEAEDGTISRSAYQNLFDAAREDLVAQFEAQTKALLTDPDVAVRRALLASVSTLCVFFGSAKASDVILSHLNTYLNDRDWMLKITFFETIVGVATYVGTAGLEEFILPLMVQALADPEESVVERVIRSFSAIAELGLFQRNTTWELIDIVAQFTMHPNSWIREAAAQFITAATTFTSTADRHGIITPMIKMYLKALPVDLSEIALLDSLKKPLPRIVLEMASSWAVKAEKGLFWKSTQQQRTFSFGYGETGSSTPGRNIAIKGLARIPKNEEDEHWIQRLRNAGMSSEDEFKLLLLREYIWRAARRKSQEEVVEPSQFNGIVALKDMDVSLQTVFFDNEKAAAQNMAIFEDEVRPRTIAEALQDASAPVDDIVPNKTSDPRGDERAGPKDIPGVAPSRDEPLSPQQWLHSPAGPSSLDSKHSLRVGEHGIQRKGSAMSLMGLRDAGGKAAAEIGTTPTNAFGKVEGSLIRDDQSKRKVSPLALARDDYRLQLQGKKIQPVHSYPGNDPSVLKLLDSLYLENYPVELIEFGQLVTPIRGQPIRRAGTGNSSSGFWRPEGVLVAMLSEHTTTINRVAVAPDHRFFVTGSDDGTVKVWDTSRLERNINHRSLHTHSQGVKVKVTSLAFVESTHCFISTGSDGSVHVIKVEVLEKNGTTRYPKLRLVREYQLPAGEFAVWTEHHKVDNQSILLLATNKSRLVAIELRTMSVLYELQNPLNHGTPTCFCVDRRHHWLLIGTSHGVMDLWDLRFKIRLKSWGFPGGTPIYRLSLAPISRGSKRYRVTIAGGAQGEITTFDIEKGQIKEIYRTNGFAAKETTIKGASATTILDLDDDQHRGGMLSRFAASSAMELNSGAPDRAIRSLVMGSHVLEDGTDPKHFFILSAGPEWKVRFWDTSQPQLSMVVSGLDVEENKPTYTPNHINDVLVVTERQVPTASTATNDPSTDSPRKGSSTQGGSAPSTPSKKSKTASKSSIISLQQQHLLKGHRDTITDVALLEYPYGMVVSVDRSGVIYVFS